MMRHESLWALAEEFLLCGQLGGAGPCMRMVGSFTVRRSPAPGHGCILQSPLGRNLKHYLRCTSTDDTRHHLTPINFVSTIHFYFSILTGDSGRQVSNGIQESSKEAIHLHDLGISHTSVFTAKSCSETFVLPQDLDTHFTLDIINCDLRQFSQMRNYWHTQKMPYFVQTS